MTLRGAIFTGFISAMWAMSVQNADYFGLPDPWGLVLMLVGAVLIGMSAPSYARTGI